MAYTLRYYKTLPQPGDRDIVLEIYEKDGAGVSMEIGPVIQALHLDIQGSQEDIDTPVVKTSLVMTFVDAPDHEEASSKKCGNWEEFYTSDSTYWKVVLKARGNSGTFSPIWGGYVTPDSFSEQLRYRGSVTIVARDNIGHLQDFPFDAKGNEDGMITVYDLVNAAWAKIESPMSLDWRGDADGALWLQCEGTDAPSTYVNVSAFEGKNWYEAVENILYSMGMTMRYIGINIVQVASLRYMQYQGKEDLSDLPRIEPKFIAYANRELAPAARRIEESVKYDLTDGKLAPLADGVLFSGVQYTSPFISENVFGEQTTYNIPVWPIANTGDLGWSNIPSSTLFLDPGRYNLSGDDLIDEAERMLFIAGNTGDSRAVTYGQRMACKDFRIEMRFGRVVERFNSTSLGYAWFVWPSKFRGYVSVEQNGITQFYTGSGWQTEAFLLEIDIEEGMIAIDVPLADFAGSAVVKLIIQEIALGWKIGDVSDGQGLYVAISSLRFASVESSMLETNRVNTNYDESNNVIISRSPAFAPAYNEVPFPQIIKNGIFLLRDSAYVPAKGWSWPGGTPQQMAVYNHLQLLCYYAKPNNVITGDIVNANLGDIRALYLWHGREHLLQGGSLNFLNGRIEGAILREFTRYESIWGDVTGDSGLPDVEQSSGTTAESSSSPSSDGYDINTEVYLGGGGGGTSITIDTEMSDISGGLVPNKIIKKYVDDAFANVDAGAVIFDATCSTDPWNLNILQTSTTLEEMAEAISKGLPIYMRFGSGLVAVANAELYENGDVSLYAHLVDSESEIIRTIHTYSADGGWAWESTDNPVGGGGDVDTAMSAISTNAVQNKVIKAYVDKAETRAYDNAIVDAGRYTDSQVASKAGAFYVEPSTNLFIVFTTEAKKAAYIANGDTSGVLGKFALGGGGGASETVYTMKINGLLSTYGYTTSSETMPISCTFKSQVKYASDDSYTDYDEDAVFTVSVLKNGGWVDVASKIVSNGATFNLDLKPYVATGGNSLKVTAAGIISGASDTKGITVNVSSLSLTPFNFNWWSPFIEGKSYGLGGLKILGSLSKTLHIKVTGSGYSREYTDAIGTEQHDEIAYKFNNLVHPSTSGVYKVEIWLTADSGELQTETLTYNIMCIASEDVSSAKLICLNEVATELQNYTENKLFAYAVYNGGALNASPSFTVVADGKTVASGELSVNTGVANTYSTSFAIASSASSIPVTATAVYGNTITKTFTLDNEASFAPVSGYSFLMDAATRNNADAYRNYFINEVNQEKIYTAWTDMAWVDGMDGWTTDSEGNKCLLIPAMSKANVNLAPMKGVSTFALEMLYKVANVADFDEDIITIATNTASSWMGLKIKPTNICLHSQTLGVDDLRQSYNTQEDTLVHLMVTVITEADNGIGNIAIIYVNGVKKCSFEWSAGDTFAHSGELKLGSDTADLYLYKMRMYSVAFSWPQVMQNYISSLHTISERVNVNRKEESVLDDSNRISYDKVYGVYNTFVIRLPKGASLPNAITNPSNEPVEGTNLYIDIVQNRNCSIQGEWLDVPIEGQGTTAMTYYRWNIRSKTSSAYDKFRITAKKNVASSMQSHKRGATALYNDLNLAIVGANEANGRVAVYQYPVYGFLEVENEDAPGTYHYDFIGLYTIGPDKGDKSTFGYDNEAYEDTLIHMEGTDHSPRGVGMDYPWEQMTVGINDDGDAFIGPKNSSGGLAEEAWEIGACGSYEDASAMKTYLNTEFSPAYMLDYECTPMIVGLPSGTTIAEVNANLSTFRAQEADNGFSYGDCLIYIDGEYDTYYFNIVTNQYVKDGRKVYDGLSSYGFSTTTLANQSTVLAKTNYIRQYRKARYRAEMGGYWHLNDSLFHACFLDLIGATDNEKKNSYPYKFGTLASGSRWRWRQDDLDTIFDVNNQGSADKKYSILNTDKQGVTMIFKGNTSYHWRCVREYYKDEMKAMMQNIMDKMVTLCPASYGSSKIEKLVGCIRHYFWDYAQDYFTGGAYNADAKWTYEDTWVLWKQNSTINAVHPLQQSLGSHYEAEKAWVTLRMLFLASMNEWGAFVDYVDRSAGQVSFRQGGDFTFSLVPAIDMRPSVIQGANSKKIHASGRVLAGHSATIATAPDSSADTMVYIQGADWLQDIGDFSKAKIGSSSQDFAVTSKRLQKLKVGDSTASNVETNIDGLTIGYCPSLMEVEARNVTTLVKEVNLSQCPRLRRAYFGGTQVPAITLADGSKVTALDLPSTIQRMKLIKLPLLRTSGLTYTDLNNLTYLWVEDNAYLDGYDMLKTALEDGSPLNNIRVVGFTKTANADDTDFLLALAEGDYHGITDAGAVDNTIAPVLVGTVNYDTIDGDVYDALKAAYGNNLTINYNKLIAFIKFADAEVLRVLIANGVDTNNDGGIEVEEAEAVTTIGTWFKGNTAITSFDEFEYFTGVTFLGTSTTQETGGAFYGCTSLRSIKLPSSVTILRMGVFFRCTSLSSAGDLSHVVTIGRYSFRNSALSGKVSLDSCTEIGWGAFNSTQITEVYAPVVQIIVAGNTNFNSTSYGAFANCKKLKKVVIGDTCTIINPYAFYGCEELEECTLPSGLVTLSWNTFQNCAKWKGVINLPNLETLGRTAFMGSGVERVENLGKITRLENSNNAGTFQNCTELLSATLPDTLTFLGRQSFQGCSSLEQVDIGIGITEIEYMAFLNCSALQSVIIRAEEPPTLGNTNAFNNTNNCPIYVPDASVAAYQAATNWSQYSDRIKPLSEYTE